MIPKEQEKGNEAATHFYNVCKEQLTAAEARIKELEAGLQNLRNGTFMNIAAVNSYIDKLLTK